MAKSKVTEPVLPEIPAELLARLEAETPVVVEPIPVEDFVPVDPVVAPEVDPTQPIKVKGLLSHADLEKKAKK